MSEAEDPLGVGEENPLGGQKSADGAEPYERGGSPPLYPKMQYGQRNKSGGNGPDGIEPYEFLRWKRFYGYYGTGNSNILLVGKSIYRHRFLWLEIDLGECSLEGYYGTGMEV